MHGCITNEAKDETGKMFLRRELDVFALTEIKMKGRDVKIFGEVELSLLKIFFILHFSIFSHLCLPSLSLFHFIFAVPVRKC